MLGGLQRTSLMILVAGSQPPDDLRYLNVRPISQSSSVRPAELAVVFSDKGKPNAQARRVRKPERLFVWEDQDIDRLVGADFALISRSGAVRDGSNHELAEVALCSFLQLMPRAQTPPVVLIVIRKLELQNQLVVRREDAILQVYGL